MDEKILAMQFAMKLIGLRRRSVFEMRTRLTKKGFNENAIEKAIKELEKFKYLSDEEFTESFIRDRLNLKPCGRIKIFKELRERGVDEKTIEEKLNALFDFEKELEFAQRMADRKLKIISKNLEKKKLFARLAAHLQSKGFSFEIISQVLQNKLK